MTAVMIGGDPHKGSHTAVAISADECPLGRMQVRACPAQAEQLVAWAQAWPDRAWAVEGAAGLGHLLARQLVAAGEYVVDVPPKLAARVRLLEAGDTNKNDPNDARSVAVAALRSKAPRPVIAEDHAAVLKVWARRHRDLSRARNQAACRLHAVLCDLVPGGVPDEITAARAERILGQIRPWSAAAGARCELAAEFLADIRNLDAQRRAAKNKLAAAVKASGTSLTARVFGVGPVIAGTVIGDVRQVSRFPSRDHFAAYNGTAPVEVSSGNRKIYRLSLRGNRRLNHAIHMAAITQIRHKHSDGRAYYERKIAEGKTRKEALRCLKRRISDAIYAALLADAGQAAAARPEGPGGQPGNLSVSGAAGSHPECRLFGQATPGPHPTLRPAAELMARASSPAADPRQRATGRPAASSQLRVPQAGRAGVKMKRPAGRTTLTPGRPAGHWPSEEAAGMRPPGHRAAPPMPGTAAGDSSRTAPVRNRRPKSISRKPSETS
jgi:transposase